MKKLFGVIIVLIVVISACGPSQEELEEKRIADSTRVADSLAQIAYNDSLEQAAADADAAAAAANAAAAAANNAASNDGGDSGGDAGKTDDGGGKKGGGLSGGGDSGGDSGGDAGGDVPKKKKGGLSKTK